MQDTISTKPDGEENPFRGMWKTALVVALVFTPPMMAMKDSHPHFIAVPIIVGALWIIGRDICTSHRRTLVRRAATTPR